MCMARFVNTMIDPLQNSYFAKSMASLATQLGLPLWFIELRHAATHEDLPSLEVLQSASKQALDYLHNTYWLPALSSKAAPVDAAPLHELLKAYKDLAKGLSKDQSKYRDIQPMITRTLRDLDGWLAAHSITHGQELAIDMLSDTLGDEGYLVPVAKSKRPTARHAQLPQALIELWMPLLDHVDSSNDGFFESLIDRLVLRISDEPSVFHPAPSSTDTTSKLSGDYYLTLMCWIRHLVSEVDSSALQDRVVKAALDAATPRHVPSLGTKASANAVLNRSLKLVSILVAEDEEAQRRVNPLLQAVRVNELVRLILSKNEYCHLTNMP